MLSRVRERLASWLRGGGAPDDAVEPLLALTDAQLQEELRRARAATQRVRAERACLQREVSRLRLPDPRKLEERRASLAAQVADLERRCGEVRQACGALEPLLEDALLEDYLLEDPLLEPARLQQAGPPPGPEGRQAPAPRRPGLPLPAERLPPQRTPGSARRASRPVGAPLSRA